MSKILLMEDDPEQSKLLKKLLEREGHDVSLERRGSDAFAAIQNAQLQDQAFNLLIADIFVRDGDRMIADGGVSLIAKIRLSEAMQRSATQPEKRLPIIAISGGYTKKDRSEDILSLVKRNGADASFLKPIDTNALIDTISNLTTSNAVEG